jgi:hypothetical protein
MQYVLRWGGAGKAKYQWGGSLPLEKEEMDVFGARNVLSIASFFLPICLGALPCSAETAPEIHPSGKPYYRNVVVTH